VTEARFAIVVGRFYEDLAERLVSGAQRAFAEAGVAEAEVHDVPAPTSCRWPRSTSRRPARSPAWPASAPSSAVRPPTTTTSATEAARGIQDVQLRTGVPCAFGVLTVESMDQALARSGGDHRDTGYHAAQVVLRMAALRAELA
jgi:6,7-dimethyl-8-ribityllumazine synthase